MAKEAKVSRRRMLAMGVTGVVGLTTLDAFAFAPKRLQLSHTKVPIRDLHPAFNGYRIALLSDFHLPNKATPDLVREAIEMALGLKPDLFALTGDFVHGKDISSMPSFKGVFDAATGKDGCYGVLGNHDHWFGEKIVRKELAENTPCQLIENTLVTIRRGEATLAVGGIGDLWEGYVVPTKTFEGVPLDVPRILLSHNPDFAEDMSAEVRVDLQLSGHTHGGEVRVPWGPAPVVPSKYGQRFREGLCQARRHRVFVTKGVATVVARLFAPPEVSVIELRAASDA